MSDAKLHRSPAKSDCERAKIMMPIPLGYEIHKNELLLEDEHNPRATFNCGAAWGLEEYPATSAP